jgi:Valyl-tRNA synthetase
MFLIQEIITSVRAMRKDARIEPSASIDLVVIPKNEEAFNVITINQAYIRKLAKVGNFEIGLALKKPRPSISGVVLENELFIPLAGLLDLSAERARMEKEITRLKGMIDTIEKKLGNEQFVSKAPVHVIEKERVKLNSMKISLAKLRENYEAMKSDS